MKLESAKSLVSNMDYFTELEKTVRSRVDNHQKFDDNLLYELAYATTYLNNLQLQSDEPLPESVLGCRDLFDTILDTAIMEGNLWLSEEKRSDYKKLLKCRYKDSKKAGYERIYEESTVSPMTTYVKQRIIPFLCILLLEVYVTSGGVRNFSMTLARGNVTESVAGIIHMISILIGLVSFLLVCTFAIGFMIDVTWLSIPAVRKISIFGNYISPQAVDADKNIKVTVKDISYDRVARCKGWLAALKGLSKLGLLEEEDDKLLKVIQRQIKSKKTKKYYLSLAKVEFLHDKYAE